MASIYAGLSDTGSVDFRNDIREGGLWTKFYRRFIPCLDSLAFANRFPSICFCSAVKILVLPVFPSRYPNKGQSAREQDLASDALSPEHCKQYERIAFNGVTMMFSPSFNDLMNSLHKLCSEIVEKRILGKVTEAPPCGNLRLLLSCPGGIGNG